MARVFIDATIFLKYVFPLNGEGDHLDKLKRIVRSGEVSLIFPKITQQELSRNIYSTFAQKCGEIDTLKIKPPNFDNVKDEDIKRRVMNAHESAAKGYASELNKIKKEYLERSEQLTAVLIEDFKRLVTEECPETEGIIHKAEIRRLKGNPPEYKYC